MHAPFAPLIRHLPPCSKTCGDGLHPCDGLPMDRACAVRHATTRVRRLGPRREMPDAIAFLRRLHTHPKVMVERAALLISKRASLVRAGH